MNNIIKRKDKYYLKTESGFRQIISSTNKSLGLPEPSKEFLEVYVDAYNEGNNIEDVLIGYELQASCYPKTTEWCLKVKPDNTITIKKVKDSWSKEEVKNLLYAFAAEHGSQSSKRAQMNWIEQNL